MSRGPVSVLAAGGAISAVTAFVRAGEVPLRALASSPAEFADGRVWLLATSALVADRPAVASIGGFVLVGLVATALCSASVAWTTAVAGHVLSAAAVYLALGVVRVLDPRAFGGALHLPDYGTSAVVAAWIGAIAYVLWSRGRPATAACLVVVSALVGWLCKGSLTVIDTEHAAALAIGAAGMRYLPATRPFRAGIPHLRLRRGCTI
jgi:hypothetical protein